MLYRSLFKVNFELLYLYGLHRQGSLIYSSPKKKKKIILCNYIVETIGWDKKNAQEFSFKENGNILLGFSNNKNSKFL